MNATTDPATTLPKLSQPSAQAKRLAEIFTDLQRGFMMRLSRQLSEDSVSFSQYFLLTFIVQQEGVTMSEIARWMGHTTAAATGMVDRLEVVGLAKRMQSKEDRRKIVVRVTPKGRNLLEAVHADIAASVERLLGHLDAEEAEMWIHIYEKIFPHCG